MARVLKSTSDLQRHAFIAGSIFVCSWLAAVISLFVFLHPHHTIGIRQFIPFFFIMLASTISGPCMIYLRGYGGELRVFRVLKQLPDEYAVFNDIHLTIEGHQAQIDHVLVCPSGLLCLETKSHLGAIYGKERDRQWTQVKHADSGRKYQNTFYNPIAQNATHCKRMQAYLTSRGIQAFPIFSLVVFTSATLHVTSTTPVVSLDDLRKTILTYQQAIPIAHQNVQRVETAICATAPLATW